MDVLLDVANLEAGARNLGGRLSPASVVQVFDHVSDVNIVAFVSVSNFNTNSSVAAWATAGAEIVSKPMSTDTAYRKGNLDTELVIYGLDVSRHRAATVVIGSGDGDFSALARTLRVAGVRVFAFSWQHCLSRELAAAVDGVVHAGRDLLVHTRSRRLEVI